ncbi:hypothetical protein RBB50_005988 [Rhinocladiella similis]
MHGLVLCSDNKTKTIAEFFVPTIRELTAPLIEPLLRLSPLWADQNRKIMLDGSHKSNNWNGIETVVGTSGQTASIEFGGFEMFCGMLQRELLGATAPTAQIIIDSDAKLCQMGIPILTQRPLNK